MKILKDTIDIEMIKWLKNKIWENYKIKYKTLLFDIDDTLLDFRKDQKFAFYKAMESIGIECTEELYESYSKINSEMWKLLNDGKITLQELFIRRFEVFFEKNHIDENPIRIKELVSQGFHKSGNPTLRSIWITITTIW